MTFIGKQGKAFRGGRRRGRRIWRPMEGGGSGGTKKEPRTPWRSSSMLVTEGPRLGAGAERVGNRHPSVILRVTAMWERRPEVERGLEPKGMAGGLEGGLGQWIGKEGSLGREGSGTGRPILERGRSLAQASAPRGEPRPSEVRACGLTAASPVHDLWCEETGLRLRRRSRAEGRKGKVPSRGSERSSASPSSSSSRRSGHAPTKLPLEGRVTPRTGSVVQIDPGIIISK
ncbi:hypothetical protein K2173_027532 [Erythroxylum novogranatense]|uniref:Uncharacterized protein n=1 Tax=Erythroxylum novogranatense TaxID=1862640 RepID=A0AAV8U1V2_9ROSI|nr:hypothetical protein K2173_027532 [Erythroxylum novogranatense]